MGETMEITSFSISDEYDIDFPELSGPSGCLLQSVDFDDLFVGIQFFDGDMLPELELDPDLLAELSSGDLDDDSATSTDCSSTTVCVSGEADNNNQPNKVSVSASDMEPETEKEKPKRSSSNSPAKDREKTKKSPSSQAKNNNSNNPGKRKTKVDWTPDLHRKFVKAVEQLGVDKAVPSRILELMGIRRLTRHNIASHLQKYRSHLKHLLEREAGAASWSLQKRQLHGAAIAVVPPGGGGKVKVHAGPTMGFPPPVAPPPPPHALQHLHVWGHPAGHHLEHQPMMPGWPNHLVPSPSPMLHYPPSPRVASFWHSHHQHRFAPPPVQGFPPPHATMYKPEHGATTSTTGQSGASHPPSHSHPTKESLDEAIGDVLSKPWLPLPIGLKPPSMDIVMEELQRQGLPNILPSHSS